MKTQGKKFVAEIVSTFNLNTENEINYHIEIKGNISDVVRLGHQVFLECKERFADFRHKENVKFDSLFNPDISASPEPTANPEK